MIINMEACSNNKRKKRKTRKYRDELRRRTHQQPNKLPHKNSDVQTYKNDSNLKSNFITSNRLTLYKTVRSNTVTRLQLPELVNRNILKLNKNKESTNLNINHIHDNNVSKQQNEMNTLDSEIENVSPTINKTSHCVTPESVILFNSESQDDEANNTKLNNSLEIVLSKSTSSISNNDSESNYYDQLMEQINKYIEKKYPQVKTCDTVEKTRKYIINAFLGNDYSDTDNNNTSYVLRDAVRSNKPLLPREIIQKPKDYVGYSWNQCLTPTITEICVSSSTESNSSDFVYIPSSSPNTPIIYDSPEYCYYPHRLN